jgi:asparagine synthase (glutamine-hydrolysing)
VARAGVFDPAAVARLWRKCGGTGAGAPPSNADNMALVGVLSTGLLHDALVRRVPVRGRVACRTIIDRLCSPGAGAGPPSRAAEV